MTHRPASPTVMAEAPHPPPDGSASWNEHPDTAHLLTVAANNALPMVFASLSRFRERLATT